MLIQHSIIAGRILTLLDKVNSPISIEKLQDDLNESMISIRGGIERLVKERLAVIDMKDSPVKIVPMSSVVNQNALRPSSCEA